MLARTGESFGGNPGTSGPVALAFLQLIIEDSTELKVTWDTSWGFHHLHQCMSIDSMGFCLKDYCPPHSNFPSLFYLFEMFPFSVVATAIANMARTNKEDPIEY